MTAFSLTTHGLCLDAPGGRPLIRNLSVSMGNERVALVGRNGVGKSSLLRVLAGAEPPTAGRVEVKGTRLLVPQLIDASDERATLSLSPGEQRRLWLERARMAVPDLLLLDEPTQDLDREGVRWLLDWLTNWQGALLVISHDRRLLRGFQHFFHVAESGCRYFSGNLDTLISELETQERRTERTYVRNLHRLVEREKHNDILRRRRQRKRNVGRIREVARAPSRALLNSKRSYAQESQGKRAVLQQERIASLRAWAQATRRALRVNLALKLEMPELPARSSAPSVTLTRVAARAQGRLLFEDIDLTIDRQRIAIVGANGTGKSTLLEIMLGRRRPSSGSVSCDPKRVGYIAQHAANWTSEQSLLSELLLGSGAPTVDAVAELLLAHQFPFALAERPLASLSPGERVRAALIRLFQRSSCPELLVLDEPTDQLDFLGTLALERVLSAWRGGLVVVSHDEEFLAAVGIDRRIELGSGLGSELPAHAATYQVVPSSV